VKRENVAATAEVVDIDGLPYVRLCLYRRVGEGDDWLFDGNECVAAPISGDLAKAFDLARDEVHERFHVRVPRSAMPKEEAN
jgi:hypothetical protein